MSLLLDASGPISLFCCLPLNAVVFDYHLLACLAWLVEVRGRGLLGYGQDERERER